MTITQDFEDHIPCLVIKLNSGIEIEIRDQKEHLTISVPDADGQCFDFSLVGNPLMGNQVLMCDATDLRKALNSFNNPEK